METTKLDQMLAMLQGMSEQISFSGPLSQISGLDLRLLAVEKKSDAAREAVDAIKKVDKEVSPRKATVKRELGRGRLRQPRSSGDSSALGSCESVGPPSVRIHRSALPPQCAL